MFSFADSITLKSAVELRIANIIHSHDGPITLSQIASCITDGLTSPDITTIARIMRLLIRRKIFIIHHPLDGRDFLFDLNNSSRWLLHDSEQTLTPIVLMENHPWQIAPWHYFSQCVKECGIAFKKAYGYEIWDLASGNPYFNKLFNDGIACSRIGGLISDIVKAYPHIKGVNFDLPHGVSTTPTYNGVSHIGGDMFHAIPNGDAVIMKVLP
ncbi:hypothetical protein PVK06_007067 [Gossypium arboreum]|uniref:O-methyltransferase n=1 Tax=Gossypium arboreum TaxID=29729 RepID=A0ABR0QHA6_GOSAR|nr:hypothetical protein PVK06_007067 [Gossypium arboreum]